MWLLLVLIGALTKDKAPDRRRIANWLGFAAPEMVPHWQRLGAALVELSHAFPNVWTEWTRADPQRAWKTYAAIGDLLVLALVAALVW
jgi:hypothetical protein